MTQTTIVPRTYDETLLLPSTLTSATLADRGWARTWVRQFLRDYPEVRTGGLPGGLGQPTRTGADVWPEFSRTDAALDAALYLDAVMFEVSGVQAPHYRPHITAARLYLGDPELWRTRSVDGSSETRRDPIEVITAWLNQGRAFDTLFPEGTVLPPFEPVTVSSSGGTVLEPDGPFVSAIPLIVGGL